MELISIYLSGSIRHKDPKAVVALFDSTKKHIENRFADAGKKCKVYSPIRGKNYDYESAEWKPSHSLKEVIARDEADIRKSDILLIMTGDNVSDGTWLEFGFAYYECKIPVVMVAPKRKRGEIVSWSNEKATYIGDSLDECVEWIVEYWGA